MKQIADDIRKNSFHRAYLLYGEETYLLQKYQQQLVKALVPEGDTMNFSRMEGKGLKEGEIIDLAETLPFFAERRVILLADTGFFKNKTDRLADYLAGLPDYLVLIFCEKDVDKRSRMYKAVKKHGCAAEFAPQKEKELTVFILNVLKRENKKISRANLELFLKKTGTDMGMIDRELEKLVSYTLGREVITAADIEAVCTTQLTNRIFEMVRAVSSGRQREALAMYYELLALKEPPGRILYLLAREFRLLRNVKLLSTTGRDQKSIAAAAGVPPFTVRNYLQIAGKYSLISLERVMEDFVAAEEAVKTGKMNDVLSVELMIIRHSSGENTKKSRW